MMMLRKILFICYREKLFCWRQFFGLTLFCSKHWESKRERGVTFLVITWGGSEGRDKVIFGDEVGFEVKFGDSLEDCFAQVGNREAVRGQVSRSWWR